MRKPKCTLDTIRQAHRLRSAKRLAPRPNTDHLRKQAPGKTTNLT